MQQWKKEEARLAYSRRTWLIAVVLSVSWVMVVYLAYYTVHKPVASSVVWALTNRLLDVAVCALMILIATALGRRTLRALPFNSSLEELILSAATGLGLVSLAVLALGLAGGLNRWLLYGITIVSALLLRRHLRSTLMLLRDLKRPTLQSWFDKGLAGYLALVLCLSFVASMTPPVAWDSQVYHLTGPELFIRQGRISGDIDIPYLGFPALLEMLFLAGMLLRSDIVAQLVHLTYLILTIGLVYTLSRRYLQGGWRLLAPALLLSAPSIVVVSTWAYVDLGLAFYTLAAFYGFVRWAKSHDQRWLLLTGIMSGFALGVKYTALLTPVVTGLLLVITLTGRSPVEIARRLGLLWLPTLAIACPWFLKNWVLMGNPFYPFFFAGRFWDAYRAWWYSRWGTGLLAEPVRLLIAPWEMTVLGVEGRAGYAATIGPLLLACLPLLGLTLVNQRALVRGSRELKYAAILCGAYYVAWLGGVARSALLQQTRLLFPVFPLVSLLAAIGVERLAIWDVRGFSLQRFVLMALTLTLFINALSFLVSFVIDNPAACLMGLETRDQYLERHLGDYYVAISYINDQLPDSARVLFLWEPRSYYCQSECWPDAILDRFLHLRYRYGDAAGIAEHLKAEGVTHVLLHEAGLDQIRAAQFDPITPEDVQTLRILQQVYWEPLQHVSESYELYRVR